MLLYIVRRIAVLIPVALTVMLITFLMAYYGPTDPVRIMLGEDWANEEMYQDMRHALGLDRPVWVQFGEYLARLARGDLGHSLRGGPPINEMIAKRLQVSASLAVWALLILVFVGVPLGVLAAVRQNTILDYAAVTTSAVLSAIPPFVLGPMMLIVFVAKLHWFETVGGWDGMFSKSAIMPAVLLAIGPMCAPRAPRVSPSAW
jgi:peptide/nickel transport system permease protein